MTLKASEGKNNKNVSKTSDNRQYSRSGRSGFSVLLLSRFVVRLVGVPVDVIVFH